MEIITLNIKKDRLDSILLSDNRLDIREVRPRTDSKYLQIDTDGYAIQDENGDFIPKQYDAIQYNVDGNLSDHLIKIDDIGCEILVDDNNEAITYEHNGETHISCQVVYFLGDAILK